MSGVMRGLKEEMEEGETMKPEAPQQMEGAGTSSQDSDPKSATC